MDINQNINNLMKEAQKMQQRMQEAQQELSQLVVTGESGGGSVKVEMTGRHDVRKVSIKPSLIDEEIEMIEDLVAAAVNDAVRKIEKESRGKIGQLTAGLNIPTEFLKDKGDKE
ncbi:MAG: nucleoid-associated protein, YbaB/EbfC family [Legionellales bacterium RIFCSPHIGHO2_12_FULL_42_9]|nr:MAG: nucleoid-associated protein, YbaB/EbfC family [Legionellales bacterium RIFCSPHIGHO2_12_FULL_42_9]